MAYMVVNSRYNPFTFDEMIKPFAMYGEAYKEQEAAANDLMTKAAILESLSPETDKAQYDSYKGWLAELQKASSDLATTGLNPQLRSTLSALNSRYSAEYAPLEDKIKTRGELVKEQRAFQQKNPNAFFDIDYDTVSLDQISPSSTYTSYNPDTIATSVGNDVYNKLNSGEAVPSMDEYLTQYGAGLKDAAKIAKVQKAIATGASLGNATYQQKEFDNYIKKVQATRRYSSSGGGSSTSYPGTTVNSPEGRAINITFNKNVGAYQITDRNNKKVNIEGETEEELKRNAIKAYYGGGEYSEINFYGVPVSMVKGSRTIDGKEESTLSIVDAKGDLQRVTPGITTNREVFKIATGIDFPELTELEKTRVGLHGMTTTNLEKNIKSHKIEPIQLSLEDAVKNIPDQNLIKKLYTLAALGIEVNITGYKNPKNENVLYGYEVSVPEEITTMLNNPISVFN